MKRPVTSEVILERFKSAHGDRFDYSKMVYKDSSTKVEIICPTHGPFHQLPSDHSRGIGCRKCSSEKNGKDKRLTLEEFKKRAVIKHNNFYNYDGVVYRDSSTRVDIKCPIHGIFKQTAIDHLSGRGCRKCKYDAHRTKLQDTTESFILKASKVHGNLYDYSSVNYINSQTNVNIFCKVHGEFQQSPSNHLSGAGCYECGRNVCGDKLRKSNNIYVDECIKKYGDLYDYSLVKYTKAHAPIKIICNKHGPFTIQACQHLNNNRGCPKCSSSVSKPEFFIGNFLTTLGVNFKTNDRSIISPLELDFVLPDYNIAIEFNGLYYHSELSGDKDRNYHLNKTKLAESNGLRLIHIFEDEYLDNPKIILNRIRHLVNKTTYKIYARKTEVREISYQQKKRFIEKYHIQGDSQSCVNLGLFYKNRLVQVMTFSKKRVSLGSTAKMGEFELSRLCSINNFNIIGGASKLLKHFERKYNPISLLSYADKRWSQGNVYKQLGFAQTHESKPNYWYIPNNSRIRYHRYKFAKHMLNKRLNTFDPNLSEWENMKNEGYDRIWDCGNIVFHKEYQK